MKICIVGLGAVGGVIAGRLGSLARAAPQRLQLAALARGGTLTAVRRQGLIFSEGEYTHTVQIEAHDDPAALGVQDLVIVAVKATALAQVAPAVAALCGTHTAVLTAMNGLPWWFFDRLSGPAQGLVLEAADRGGVARSHIATPRVLGAVLHFSASAPAPGHVRLASGNGLILGLPGGQAMPGEPASALFEPVAQLLADAGLELTRSPQIERDIWFKLWGNMTFNPVSALTGATGDLILDDELLRGFVSGVMLEAQALGAAVGLPIAQTPEQRHAVTRKLGAFRTSMLQDLQAGRPLEIDALLGAPHELARRLGQPTPMLAGLLGLVRVLARVRGL